MTAEATVRHDMTAKGIQHYLGVLGVYLFVIVLLLIGQIISADIIEVWKGTSSSTNIVSVDTAGSELLPVSEETTAGKSTAGHEPNFFQKLGKVITAIVQADFLKPANLTQILLDVAMLGIVAIGVSFITYGGNYVDLSIPTIMSVSGIVTVALLPFNFGMAILAGITVGVLMGAINGAIVGYLKLNPIIWTLAALSIFDGVTRWAYGGKWIYAEKGTASGDLFSQIYNGRLPGNIPVAVVFLFLTAIAGYVVMRHSGYGKRLQLTGSNYEAARLTGVNVRKTVLISFAISGFTAALAGIIKTSFNMYGDVEAGLTYDFQAITAVVLGGTALSGGRGSMLGVLGGVLVIGLLGKILPMIPGVGQDEQFFLRGVIFIVVVGISAYAYRKGGRDDS